jgi:hypothetical protein
MKRSLVITLGILGAWPLAISAFAAGPAAAAPWTALHFSTGVSFNHTIAVGDLNHDGKLDVAVPNSLGPAVTVLLGNGDGTLAPFHAYPTHGDPQDVVMADLTGDGVRDLATADYTGDSVTVLRGLGDGTFAPGVFYAAGAQLVSLTAVDLDGDGRLDLALSKDSNNTIVILPALSGGGFGAAIEVGAAAAPHQIAAGDLNHDGHADLVLASFGAGTASVYLGNGTFTPGAATQFAAGAGPAVGISVADLNGDGNLDLVVSNVNATTISVLLGNGDGTFAPAVPYPVDPRPRGMDVGDLDGDGVPDVVAAAGYPDGDSLLTVYRGVGDGTLQLVDHLRLPYRAADCVIADMNGDGWNDIVATGPQAGEVTVLLNPRGTAGVSPVDSHAGVIELTIHPNPIRATATLRYRAAEPGTLAIFDAAGRRVADLGRIDAGSGWQTATWRGDNARGQPAPAGIYFARLAAGGRVVTRRVVLARP